MSRRQGAVDDDCDLRGVGVWHDTDSGGGGQYIAAVVLLPPAMSLYEWYKSSEQPVVRPRPQPEQSLLSARSAKSLLPSQ